MDVRREHGLINKHYRHHTRNYGDHVVWFEFDKEETEYDNIYDYGDVGTAGRTYKTGVPIPTIYVEEIEDQNRAIEEGRQPVENIRAIFSMEDLRRCGITEPWEYQPHLNDLFFYDGRYFKVYEYRVRGRLRGEVLVAVEGVEVYVDQEMTFDNAPVTGYTENYAWPNTLPKVV